MRYFLIAYLVLVAISAMIGATEGLSALRVARDQIETEYEDFYGLISLVSICVIVATYCAYGVAMGIRRSIQTLGPVERACSLGVFLLGVLMLFAAWLDPILLVPAFLVISCPVAYLRLGRERITANQMTVMSDGSGTQ